MSKIAYILIVTSIISSARSQTWITGSNQLQPVHGLYVKPSSDGSTGDLYVAATEESGSKAQWLTDQPVNFLPAPAQQVTQTIPIAFPTFPAHEEGSTTQKRAIISTPAPVQYAYAIPINPTEGAQLQYPAAAPESTASPCEKVSAIPCNPYQFFYPQIIQASLQAYANAKNFLKDTGLSEEKASAVIPQASPFWPSGYSYPPYPMYVMMDPSAWAQAQPAQTASTAQQVDTSPK